MALCHEFGVRICDDTCTIAMIAGSSACFCAHCGAVCEGQFTGCAAVWASGRNGEGIEVDIRVAGPVEGAQCQSPRDKEAVKSNGSHAGVSAQTGLLGDVKALVEHMEEMQQQVDRLVGGLGRGLSALAEQQKAVDRRLAQLEAILRAGGVRADPLALPSAAPDWPTPAWAEQMRQQLLELRAAMANLIG